MASRISILTNVYDELAKSNNFLVESVSDIKTKTNALFPLRNALVELIANKTNIKFGQGKVDVTANIEKTVRIDFDTAFGTGTSTMVLASSKMTDSTAVAEAQSTTGFTLRARAATNTTVYYAWIAVNR